MSKLRNHVLAPPNLRRAWTEIADNGGSAGVDNVSVAVWQRNWEERLVQLAADVRANRYEPGQLRERCIPKSNGREMRLLRIPTVTDRVLQRAVFQVLQPILEPRFLDCSFGYRPGRGVADAVRAITRFRRQSFIWVLDADIDDFFNQVDHALLQIFLEEDLPDNSLLPLIAAWNKVDCLTPACDRGIPMGSPLSPLLANLFLHRLDMSLADRVFPIVRFADDFVVLAGWRAGLDTAYTLVGETLAGLNLRYEPHKTCLTSFEEGFDFLGVHFEETWYWYLWGDKRIEVRNPADDRLLDQYKLHYS